MAPFGFLQTSIGLGFTLLFAGFLLMRKVDFTTANTYLSFGLLAGSCVFFADIIVRGIFCPKPMEDGERSEHESLLSSETGSNETGKPVRQEDVMNEFGQ